MGEEAKQEEAPSKVEEKLEEAPAPAPEAAEEKKEEEAPKPPSPLVLSVELHCVGCAKKIERSLYRIRGVEGVVVDMDQNQLTIKGVVDHQAVCNKILQKTKRSPKILSPQPTAEGQPIPEIVSSLVSAITTVELNVNMHCEACALQLKKKILQMKGVQSAETELSTGKVTVTGTMDGHKLVEYVYRRTKKQAKIVPQPEPEPVPEPENKPEDKKEEEKPAEEAKPAEEKKEEEAPPPPPPPAAEEEAKKEEGGGGGGEPAIHGESMNMNMNMSNFVNPMMMRQLYEESMRRMAYNNNNYYQPLYVIDPIPPAPQLFSDENPNACCIS